MQQKTFPELGVAASVTGVLARRNIVTPTAVQEMVLPDAMAGRDVLAKAPTGSGKTFAFGLPIVQRLDPDAPKPSALVLVPTRELAVQVAEELAEVGRTRGLRAAAAYGGVSIAAQSKAVGQAHILIATPGRLDDLARRRMVRLDRIQILILDEAGPDARHGIPAPGERHREATPDRPTTMFFFADASRRRRDDREGLDPRARRHEVHTDTPTVEEAEHRFVKVDSGSKVDALVKLLTDEPGRSLVFVRTKRGADRLATKLKDRGLRAVAMHAATWASPRGRRPWHGSRRARWTRWWPPTWPPAGWTSSSSRT